MALRRCVYCGHPCRGTACQYHKDLLAKDYYGVVRLDRPISYWPMTEERPPPLTSKGERA